MQAEGNLVLEMAGIAMSEAAYHAVTEVPALDRRTGCVHHGVESRGFCDIHLDNAVRPSLCRRLEPELFTTRAMRLNHPINLARAAG